MARSKKTQVQEWNEDKEDGIESSDEEVCRKISTTVLFEHGCYERALTTYVTCRS